MKSKKLLSLILSLVVGVSVLAGCSTNNKENVSSTPSSSTLSSSSEAPKVTMNIGTLKGPTAIGMVKLMEDDSQNKTANDYNFTIAGSPDEMVSKIMKGEVDIAAVPTNLASVLYNKTQGKIQLAAINTLGVLYILEKGDTVKSIADLKGKTIYATGKGSTPEFVLNYILQKNGLEPNKDVTIEYKSEHSELAALMSANKAAIALLPEPFVTSVTTKTPEVRVAIDVTKEWEKAADNSQLAMGAIVVRKEFAEQNKEAVNKFLNEYNASTEYINKNIEDGSPLVEKYDIMPSAVAKKAIKNCNIVYMDGEKMSQSAASFLDVLFKAEPKSVGGKLPNADFYYKK